jgi:N6-adenosine-specific RNA methylase IME4
LGKRDLWPASSTRRKSQPNQAEFAGVTDPFQGLPRNHFGAIYADPATKFATWSDRGMGRSADNHYQTMTWEDLEALPVCDLAAPDCALLIWATWPCLIKSLNLITAWGFTYKTCGFDWMKADVSTIDLFPDPKTADMKMGYWTRSNSEPCLLATRGKPKRLHADVRMGVIEPAREHSRKPDTIRPRIERLVAGPYLELFGRTPRKDWTVWGNQADKFRESMP